MKKLYTLLLSLCCCAVASAQTLSLTVDGESVANGSTFTKVYNDDVKIKLDLPTMKIYANGLYPEVFLTSSVNQNARVTFTDPNKEENTSVCFGGKCEAMSAANNYTVVSPSASSWAAMPAGNAEDLQIHYEAISSNMTGEKSAGAYGRTVILTALTEGGETFSCTLVFKYDPNAASVSSTVVDAAHDAYYTLSGVKVAAPTRGIYVRGGKKVVVR